MSLDENQKRIDQLREIAGDDEAAHSEEDDLRRDVLRAIADGECDDPAAAARLVLTTSEIRFARWCA